MSQKKSENKIARLSKILKKNNTFINNEPQTYRIEKIINALNGTHKWKSLDIDKIANFCLHRLSSTHKLMTKLILKVIKEPEKYLIGTQK